MFSCTGLYLSLLTVATHALPVLPRSAPNLASSGDAPFSVSQDTLAAALTCPNGNPTASSPGVLLVHGTTSTGAETWAEGYVPALKANGYTACYVTLPNRAMGDMQVSSEYIAYNLKYLSLLSNGAQVAVISHSQGGPDTQWALRFWPSARAVTRAFIPLSPDFTGVALLDSRLSPVCRGIQCQASLWQQAQGSNYYRALQAKDFRALVPTTAIYTLTDEVVVPSAPNAALPGAKVLAIQQLCPLRITDHVFMTIDAAAFAFALDALNHGGTASLTRTLPSALTACFRVEAKGMQVSITNQLEGDINSLVDGIILGAGAPRLSAEPAVKSYAL
nr:hypothetical protein B0A51_15163 [Rachicladosporium sp. CCFEE 5018]